jgi:hypothetical protein
MLLFSNVNLAAECDNVLQSIRKIGDVRKYLRCVVKQIPNGAIFAWAVAVVISVGGRSLFINNDNYENSRSDIDVWGQ